MAARKNLSQTQKTRDRIRTSQLINRLEKHIDGEVELSPTQIKAIEMLIDRTLPRLKQVEHTGEGGGPIRGQWDVSIVHAKDPNT